MYTENIEKDTAERKSYLDSIENFISISIKKADTVRVIYISPKKLSDNPEKYRKDFINLLGYPLTVYSKEKEKPVKFLKNFVAEDEEFNIYRLQFEIMEGFLFYGMLFEPKEIHGKLPLVIALHGGGGTPEVLGSIHMDSANYNHMVRRTAKKGAIVFAPQLALWNTENYGNPFDRVKINSSLKQLGGSITALEIFLIMRSVDCLNKWEYIDKDKTGIVGLSYGGMYALFTAAADKRIKSVYSSCFLNDRMLHNRPDWEYFNACRTFLDAETAALICPRPLFISMGKNDDLFKLDLGLKEFERLKPYYEYRKASEKLKLSVFEGWHEFDKNDEGLDFLFSNLIP